MTFMMMMVSSRCVQTETSPEHQQRSSEMHSKKTVLIKTIETRDGEVKHTEKHLAKAFSKYTAGYLNVPFFF